MLWLKWNTSKSWLKWNTSICALYTRDVYYIGVLVEVFELTLTEHFVVLDLSSCSSRWVQLKQAGVLLSLFASFGAPFLWSAEFGPRPVVPILQPLCLSLFLMTHRFPACPLTPPVAPRRNWWMGPIYEAAATSKDQSRPGHWTVAGHQVLNLFQTTGSKQIYFYLLYVQTRQHKRLVKIVRQGARKSNLYFLFLKVCLLYPKSWCFPTFQGVEQLLLPTQEWEING